MEKSARCICALSLFALIVAGCGPSRRGASDSERLRAEISDLRTLQAEHTASIAALQTDLRNLIGRMDELEFTQRGIGDLRSKLSSLQRRVPPPAFVSVDDLEADEAVGIGLEPAIRGPFLDALLSIRAGNFDAALELLRTLDLSTGDEWTALGHYWKGVALEGSTDYGQALASYQEVITMFPKHRRAASAMYRQSFCLAKLGDKKPAKLVLQKLLAEHPKAREAALARKRLNEL